MFESRFSQRDGAARCVLVQHPKLSAEYSPSLEKRDYKASQDDLRIQRPARLRYEGARDRYRRSSTILRHLHAVDTGDRRHDGSQQILAMIDT